MKADFMPHSFALGITPDISRQNGIARHETESFHDA
jgi:hypothetical protein